MAMAVSAEIDGATVHRCCVGLVADESLLLSSTNDTTSADWMIVDGSGSQWR